VNTKRVGFGVEKILEEEEEEVSKRGGSFSAGESLCILNGSLSASTEFTRPFILTL